MKYAEQLYMLFFACVVGSVVCLICYGVEKGTKKLSGRNYERHSDIEAGFYQESGKGITTVGSQEPKNNAACNVVQKRKKEKKQNRESIAQKE